MKTKISTTDDKLCTTENISLKEKLSSRFKKIQEYIKEMHFRYQCYYKIEVTGWKYGYTRKGWTLHYYLTHPEEECKKTREQMRAEIHQLIDCVYQQIGSNEEGMNRGLACSNNIYFQ